jgi:hypothetical protein
MKACSVDLRNKIIESVNKGVSKSQTARNALVRAKGGALDASHHSAKDAGGFFAHRGYGTSG